MEIDFHKGVEVIVLHRSTTETGLAPAIQHICGNRENLAEYRSTFERIATDVVVEEIAISM